MKLDIAAIWVVTSVYHHPAMFDDVTDALDEAVYRLKDPMEAELKIGDYGREKLIDVQWAYIREKGGNSPKKVSIQRLTDHLENYRKEVCPDMPTYQ
jgi:hypothetical protein